MTIEERVRAEWLKQAVALPGTPAFQTTTHGNDFYWTIELSNGWRFTVKKELAIPEGGFTDEQIVELTAKVVGKMADQIARQRIKEGAKP